MVKRLQAQARYLAWFKKLKGKWLDAAREGDLEAPETHSFQNRAVVMHVYRCRRCSKVSSLSELRRFPCSKRNKSKGVTVANWISKWQGVEKALAHQDQTRSATRKFYSQKRRAGSEQPEAKGSKKRKAAGSWLGSGKNSSADPLLGGASIAAGLSPVLLTVNVTALTKARLLTVLEEAKRVKASFIALQETRHKKTSCPWAARIATSHGWNSAWSEPPPSLRSGGPRQGGTALLWQSSARSAPFSLSLPDDERHRVCGRVFRDLAVISFYGPASNPDPGLLAGVMRQAADLHKPVFLLGDFNWKPAYEPVTAAFGAGKFPVIGTVLGSLRAAPSRCLSIGNVSLQGAESFANSLAGIPHHKAVCYKGGSFEGSLEAPVLRTRYRRTARFKWSLPSSLTEAQTQALVEACNLSFCPGSSLSERFKAWHTKAETACETAVGLGLAHRECRGERPKGSEPSIRPVAPGPVTRPGEPLSLRRWRRLHRAAAEQARIGGDNAALTGAQRRHWRAMLGPNGDLPDCQSDALQRSSLAVTAEEQALSHENQLRWRRFSVANSSLLKVAKDALRSDNHSGTSIDSAAMTQEWAPRWTAVHPRPDAAWEEVCRASHVATTGPADLALPGNRSQRPS